MAALTATRLSNRFGIGPTTIAVGALWGPAVVAIGLAPEGNAAIPILLGAQLVAGFSIITYNIIQVSYRQAICPPRLQGRMNSVDAVHRLGDDPDRHARRRRARHLGRTARDDRHRRYRHGAGRALDRLLAAAPPPRDARADRGRTDDHRGSGRPSPARATRSPRPTTSSDVRLWPTGGLWRHADFLKLWSAETISQFGTQVSQLALPLVAILVLDASAFEVAALGTVEFLPFILFTLPAGVWVDRLRRRPILIAGDLGRAALLLTVPVAYVARRAHARRSSSSWASWSATAPCSSTSRTSRICPSLVERDQIIDGNSKLEISRSAAQIGGPGLGGAARRDLHGAVRGPRRRAELPRVGPLPPPDRRAARRPRSRARSERRSPSMWVELKEGLRFVARQPEPASPGGLHRDVEHVREPRLRGPPRLRRP